MTKRSRSTRASLFFMFPLLSSPLHSSASQGQAKVFTLLEGLDSMPDDVEVYVVLEGSTLVHVTRALSDIMLCFIVPGTNASICLSLFNVYMFSCCQFAIQWNITEFLGGKNKKQTGADIKLQIMSVFSIPSVMYFEAICRTRTHTHPPTHTHAQSVTSGLEKNRILSASSQKGNGLINNMSTLWSHCVG